MEIHYWVFNWGMSCNHFFILAFSLKISDLADPNNGVCRKDIDFRLHFFSSNFSGAWDTVFFWNHPSGRNWIPVLDIAPGCSIICNIMISKPSSAESITLFREQCHAICREGLSLGPEIVVPLAICDGVLQQWLSFWERAITPPALRNDAPSSMKSGFSACLSPGCHVTPALLGDAAVLLVLCSAHLPTRHNNKMSEQSGAGWIIHLPHRWSHRRVSPNPSRNLVYPSGMRTRIHWSIVLKTFLSEQIPICAIGREAIVCSERSWDIKPNLRHHPNSLLTHYWPVECDAMWQHVTYMLWACSFGR